MKALYQYWAIEQRTSSENIRTIFPYLNFQKLPIASLPAASDQITQTYFPFRTFIISKGRYKERNTNASSDKGCEPALNHFEALLYGAKNHTETKRFYQEWNF